MDRPPPPESLTALLRAAHGGDRAAADRAFAELYPDLLRIARARLRSSHRPDTLLNTQALVHESFLHFVQGARLTIADRKHFFAYAAKTMRHIVIDFARHRNAARRGGGGQDLTLDTQRASDVGAGQGADAAAVLDVERVLNELELLDAKLAQVVEMRYFGGCTDAEIALAMDITDRSVRRYWDKARAFMRLRLQGNA
ncbi:ECF-type sigma factor [Paucibacter sp. PLA-PC-4]|uniref:ECF-type sigma factor n=1 Tax=Paucibacter sp. PLA-PC-4 TaxID=2993655 RepID=UPI002249893E|nr:ECF-type sigma factor [Paucibacter sp. PLA-PC-4]MCX2862986.1 ECF-type sigma factor [Paucibacter sp. PLA-PC-4]